MDEKQFLSAARDISNYIVNYLENIRERRVLPNVEPGYLRSLIPAEAPDAPETWRDIMNDIERVIMPGITHWQSPQFHAYFPATNSYPSMLADMLSSGIGCIGFSWASSPACTELEVVMLDWLGQLLGLPEEFLAASGGKGGGVIQGSASEATLLALLAAKTKKLKEIKDKNNLKADDPTLTTRLVAYTSDQSHSSVEKAGMITGIVMRKIPSDEQYAMRGPQLRQAVETDQKNGLIPFYVVSTMGTTSVCSFDNLREIGEVALEFGMWHHVDAAYAGSALICEEFRYLADGLELTESFNFGPHKWLLVNYDCSVMWIKHVNDLVDALNVDAHYLRYDQQGKALDYRHWQIPLGRRFRSLKLWFTMRLYGKKGLQDHIRKQVALAHQFEEYVKADPLFEIILPVTLGLACFRLKKSNEVNEALLKALNDSRVIHLSPSMIKDAYFLRFAVCSRYTESHDIELAWREIKKQAEIVLQQQE